MRKFNVSNVHCESCANTIKNVLSSDFGKIEVDLTKEPRQILLEIEDKDLDKLREELDDLGYELLDEDKN